MAIKRAFWAIISIFIDFHFYTFSYVTFYDLSNGVIKTPQFYVFFKIFNNNERALLKISKKCGDRKGIVQNAPFNVQSLYANKPVYHSILTVERAFPKTPFQHAETLMHLWL